VAGIPPIVHPASSSDHNFFLQIALQTERSIGELKTGLEAVAKSNEKHGAKIDSLNETVHTAKGFLKAITIIGGIFGAIGLTLLAAILKMLGDHFSKH
jgi:hypothetical protein